jgi:hypothetical protein
LILGNVVGACESFEKVLVTEDNYETRKILASLYALSSTTKQKALPHFEALKRLLKSYEEEDGKFSSDDSFIRDPEMLLELAMISEHDSIKTSLFDYTNVLNIMDETGIQPQPELLNNIAALHHLTAESYNADADISQEIWEQQKNRSFKCAENLLERAMLILTDETFIATQHNTKINSILITIRFNIARLNEAKGDISKAQMQYKDILSLHPAYIDCT